MPQDTSTDSVRDDAINILLKAISPVVEEKKKPVEEESKKVRATSLIDLNNISDEAVRERIEKKPVEEESKKVQADTAADWAIDKSLEALEIIGREIEVEKLFEKESKKGQATPLIDLNNIDDEAVRERIEKLLGKNQTEGEEESKKGQATSLIDLDNIGDEAVRERIEKLLGGNQTEGEKRRQAKARRETERKKKTEERMEARKRYEAKKKAKEEAAAKTKAEAEAEANRRAESEAAAKTISEEEKEKRNAEGRRKAEEERKEAERTAVSVSVIEPEDCEVMISFNDSSAGEDAEKLTNFLTRKGHPTFCTRIYCPRNAGKWREKTINGVAHCKYYVMLMTNGWQKSNECQFETECAIERWVNHEVTFIPVRYDDFDSDYDKNGGFDSKGKSVGGKHYKMQFNSTQSINHTSSDEWMQDVFKLLR